MFIGSSVDQFTSLFTEEPDGVSDQLVYRNLRECKGSFLLCLWEVIINIIC